MLIRVILFHSARNISNYLAILKSTLEGATLGMHLSPLSRLRCTAISVAIFDIKINNKVIELEDKNPRQHLNEPFTVLGVYPFWTDVAVRARQYCSDVPGYIMNTESGKMNTGPGSEYRS